MIEHTPEAIHHLCFDRDRAGRMFAVNFALQKEGRVFTSHLSPDKERLVVTDMTKGVKRHELSMEPFDFKTFVKGWESTGAESDMSLATKGIRTGTTSCLTSP